MKYWFNKLFSRLGSRFKMLILPLYVFKFPLTTCFIRVRKTLKKKLIENDSEKLCHRSRGQMPVLSLSFRSGERRSINHSNPHFYFHGWIRLLPPAFQIPKNRFHLPFRSLPDWDMRWPEGLWALRRLVQLIRDKPTTVPRPEMTCF